MFQLEFSLSHSLDALWSIRMEKWHAKKFHHTIMMINLRFFYSIHQKLWVKEINLWKIPFISICDWKSFCFPYKFHTPMKFEISTTIYKKFFNKIFIPWQARMIEALRHFLKEWEKEKVEEIFSFTFHFTI
jgi:hypothetical protein